MPPSDKKQCPHCGEEILAVAKKCRYCQTYLDGRRQDTGRSAGMLERLVIPVERPMSSIAAGYLALFGVIPVFGLPFSLGAVICGLVALQTIKKDRELSGAGRAWFGIILGGITTLFSAIVLIAMLTIPRSR